MSLYETRLVGVNNQRMAMIVFSRTIGARRMAPMVRENTIMAIL